MNLQSMAALHCELAAVGQWMQQPLKSYWQLEQKNDDLRRRRQKRQSGQRKKLPARKRRQNKLWPKQPKQHKRLWNRQRRQLQGVLGTVEGVGLVVGGVGLAVELMVAEQL